MRNEAPAAQCKMNFGGSVCWTEPLFIVRMNVIRTKPPTGGYGSISHFNVFFGRTHFFCKNSTLLSLFTIYKSENSWYNRKKTKEYTYEKIQTVS